MDTSILSEPVLLVRPKNKSGQRKYTTLLFTLITGIRNFSTSATLLGKSLASRLPLALIIACADSALPDLSVVVISNAADGRDGTHISR